MSNVLHTQCRVCQSDDLTEVVNLGEQAVSDFVTKDNIDKGYRCPIILDLCGYCGLVQQRYTAPQDFLYTRHYWFRSGLNEGIKNALRDVAESAQRYVQLASGDVVLDIGSNDGTLLRAYPSHLTRIGIEPATNLQSEGRKGIDLLVSDMWGVGNPMMEGFIEGMLGQVKVVTAIGMFYDTDTPNQFIADVAKVLHPDGVFIAQLMCLKQTVESFDIGNACHEHLLFFSLRSLATLLEKNGLRIQRIEENTVNGGSYRIYARHADLYPNQEREVRGYFIREMDMGLSKVDVYWLWTRAIASNAAKVYAFLLRAKQEGKRVMGLGASTKGNVILQYGGIDSQLVECIADRSPEKHGRYTVGTGIPIVGEEVFRNANPRVDYALVLPYGLVDTFVEREREWLEGGGQFIVPLPEPYVLSMVNGLLDCKYL